MFDPLHSLTGRWQKETGQGPTIFGGPSLSAFPQSRAVRTLLVADIVESVRLFEGNEADTVTRCVAILTEIEASIVPRYEGRLIKGLGDGVLLEFRQVAAAVSAAFAIQRICQADNRGRPAERQIMMRIGIETGDVLILQENVFGHCVNLATRLATLAGPGETVVSARVREHLTPLLDADIEDLGECYLKHVSKPIRAFRVGPPGPRPVIADPLGYQDILPAIAVVPFVSRDPTPEHHFAGDVLAEELIRDLSCSPDLRVISRLSTGAFRYRGHEVDAIRAHLNSDFVLSGTYVLRDAEIDVSADLVEAITGRMVWSVRFRASIASLIEGTRERLLQLVREIRAAVMAREVERTRGEAVPTLKSYSLLMASIALMHRGSRDDFEEAYQLLQAVIERGRRQALPQAWLAHWYVLRMQQGWSPDLKRDAWQAQECAKLALDADPDCSLALTIDGLVHTHFRRRLDIAQERYDLAVQHNPSDSLAWLLKGTMHAFKGEGRLAVDNTHRARMLSPLDPQSYYYDSLAGTACLAAEDWAGALRLAARSLRANSLHTSTWRVAAIAAWQLGRHAEARDIARKLLQLEPKLTIARYLARSPAALFKTGQVWAEALREAGVPP